MNIKTIIGKNGSILGRIPIKMSGQYFYENGLYESAANPARGVDAEAQRNSGAGITNPGERGRTLHVNSSAHAPPVSWSHHSRGAQTNENEQIRGRSRSSHQRAAHDRGRNESRAEREGGRGRSAAPSQRNTPQFSSRSVPGLVQHFMNTKLRDDGDSDCSPATENECFFPRPMITFLVDMPKIVCQICKESELKMAVTAKKPDSHTPSILPCGHVACHDCLQKWLENNQSCPFCRKTLTHRQCLHAVKPILLAYDTICTLPKTLSMGGCISHICQDCYNKETLEKATSTWMSLVSAIRLMRNNNVPTDNDSADDDDDDDDDGQDINDIFENVAFMYGLDSLGGGEVW